MKREAAAPHEQASPRAAVVWGKPSGELRRALVLTATLIGFTFLWEIVCRAFSVPVYLVPAPSDIAIEFYEMGAVFVGHTWTTVVETVAGFALAVVFGVLAAAIIVVIPALREVVMPILLIAQIVPKVAIAPILLIWFGFGLLPKVLVAFLVAFFPIVVNCASGLASVQPELMDLGRSLEASRWQTFWKFRIPTALPALFGGMKIAVTLAVIGAVIGEFVGGNSGLGYLIIVANQELNAPLAFAAIILLSLVGIILYGVVDVAERILIPWNAPEQPGKSDGIP